LAHRPAPFFATIYLDECEVHQATGRSAHAVLARTEICQAKGKPAAKRPPHFPVVAAQSRELLRVTSTSLDG